MNLTLYARRLAQVNSVISACDRRAVEDTSTVLGAFRKPIGSVSKPCTPGEQQNSWSMDVHPPKNGINRY